MNEDYKNHCIRNLHDGYYPTNWVHQSDLPDGTRKLTHDEMVELAELIGDNDTANDNFWLSVNEFIEYRLTKE